MLSQVQTRFLETIAYSRHRASIIKLYIIMIIIYNYDFKIMLSQVQTRFLETIAFACNDAKTALACLRQARV